MLTNTKVLAVIPARWASTRFPGKPTADIFGKPMVQWVFEQVQKSNLVNDVIVATDDKRIYDVVCEFGGNAVMTSPNHKSGTDRAAEVAKKNDCDIVVNIQGDEPLIPPENIDLVIKPLLNSTELHASTLMIGIINQNEMFDPNICKVVFDKEGYALYFTRAPVPYNRDSSLVENMPINKKVICKP
jgi:3-deoxy-manno-octulosonate cytidylyltransferase (CMP-KDO synthetase)